jgi:hypothetical protein
VLMLWYCDYLTLSHAVVRTGAIRIGMLDNKLL